MFQTGAQKKPKNDPNMKRLRQNTRIDIPSEEEINRHHGRTKGREQLMPMREEEPTSVSASTTRQQPSNRQQPSTSSVSAGLRGLSIDKNQRRYSEHCVKESKFLGAKVKENVQYIVIGNPNAQKSTQEKSKSSPRSPKTALDFQSTSKTP